MRKVFNVLAILFILVGLVFAILPMGTLGLLPVGLAVIFSGLAFIIADEAQKKLPKILLLIAALLLVVVMIKAYAIPNEVAEDVQFEKQKVQSNNEDIQDLEELEGLE